MRRRRGRLAAAAAGSLAALILAAGVARAAPPPAPGGAAGPHASTQAVLAPPVSIRNLGPAAPAPETRMHPPVRFLDADGDPVVESGRPLSLRRTCGGCHDTAFIAKSNYHAQVGLDERFPAGQGESGRPWDTSPGLFGRWNPLTYRVLTPEGDETLDMGTADWVTTMGPRHVGGGPARQSRHAPEPLGRAQAEGAMDPEALVLDAETGRAVPWDWERSGTVEVNCLLCHMKAPNNAERVAATRQGKFAWASAATLEGTGLVERTGDGYRWVRDGFDARGRPVVKSFRISHPESANCRLCHGKACRCRDPVVFENSLENWGVETTGEVFSPEKLSASGMNLKDKASLTLPWDVHAERLFQCADCHGSMNNPVTNDKGGEARPRHLAFDSRRMDVNDYLHAPDHNLAKGHSAQGTVARRLDGTMRDCRDCHNAEAVHGFLPYRKLHFERLDCQACHIPRVYAPVRQVTDWTVITPQGEPVLQHRGVEGRVNDPASLITGYEPALLEYQEGDAAHRLSPTNLLTSWFWVGGDPERPVRQADLRKAFLSGDGGYRTEILDVLDADGDGELGGTEPRLDTPEKVEGVAAVLRSVGVDNPRIRGEIQPYTLSHGVAAGRFALRDCRQCHSYDSRIDREVTLSAYVPGGVVPRPVGDSDVDLRGGLSLDGKGRLRFRPEVDPQWLYIHGSDRMKWMDGVGILVLAGSVFGVAAHGGLRILSSRRRRKKGRGI